jgi:y4mF family transcriptional regulator
MIPFGNMSRTRAKPKPNLPKAARRSGGKSASSSPTGLQKARAAPGPSAKTPMIALPVRLSELGKAFSRIDLTPISEFGEHIARASGVEYPPPLPKPQKSSPLLSQTTLVSIQTLGAMVRDRREALKLSQQTLATRAGVGRRFVSELENGKPSLEFDKVLAVARTVGIDLLAAARRAEP